MRARIELLFIYASDASRPITYVCTFHVGDLDGSVKLEAPKCELSPSQMLYVKCSKSMKVYPIQAIIKGLASSRICVKHKPLGEKALKAVSVALVVRLVHLLRSVQVKVPGMEHKANTRTALHRLQLQLSLRSTVVVSLH